MSGKMPNYVFDLNNADPNLSRAYCEGMQFRTTGTALETAKADNNPHVVGDEFYLCWNAGWDAADAEAGGTLTFATAGNGICACVGKSVAI